MIEKKPWIDVRFAGLSIMVDTSKVRYITIPESDMHSLLVGCLT
jgi:hypothetical protein